MGVFARGGTAAGTISKIASLGQEVYSEVISAWTREFTREVDEEWQLSKDSADSVTAVTKGRQERDKKQNQHCNRTRTVFAFEGI